MNSFPSRDTIKNFCRIYAAFKYFCVCLLLACILCTLKLPSKTIRHQRDAPLLYTPDVPEPYHPTNENQRFITAAGERTLRTPQGHVMYRNVCIAQHDGTHRHPFEGHLQIFDSTVTDKVLIFPIQLKRIHIDRPLSYWRLESQNTTMPPSWRVSDELAIFPSFWRDRLQIFLFLMQLLPHVNGQLEWAQDVLQGQKFKSNLIAPKYRRLPMDERKSFDILGFDKVSDFDYLTANGPLCFSRAVFGITDDEFNITITKEEPVREKILAYQVNQSHACKQYHVLLIQRKGSRQILDMDFLVKKFKEHNYTNVRVEYFEEYDFFEQIDLIRCSSVYIAMQGAALAWYEYLPRNATVIELITPAWPTRYLERINATRPDIYAINILCIPEIPEDVYQKYAYRWFGHRGHIDLEMKRKLVIRSRDEYPIRYSIWKDGHSWCSPSFFLDTLPRLDARINPS